jgi:elongator complex protein 3
MPGLPGSNPKKDLQLFKKLFSSQDFKPDQIKIYPCQVLPGSELAEWYKNGKYEPYSTEELVKVLTAMKLSVPHYCRIMRVMREIPPKYMIAGTKRIDLRKVLNEEIKKSGKKCKCIRCREIGLFIRDNPKAKIDNNLYLKRYDYNASDGKEIFLEFINKENIIFGLCRLRIIRGSGSAKTAFVRELHVYGPEIEIGKLDKNLFQHKGLGRKLMKQAEELAKAEGCKVLNVISGVGVREYYLRLGYHFSDQYMAKNLK